MSTRPDLDQIRYLMEVTNTGSLASQNVFVSDEPTIIRIDNTEEVLEKLALLKFRLENIVPNQNNHRYSEGYSDAILLATEMIDNLLKEYI